VAAPAAQAFRTFTEDIGAWWPLDRLSVLTGTVAFEGDLLVERSGEERAIWAEVTEWRPPFRLGLAWHPGSAIATDVRVTFIPDGSGTIVSLEHSGWERLADPQASADEYGSGWPGVLELFAAAGGSTAETATNGPEEDWYVLLHRVGPAVPPGGSLSDTAGFRLHREFLDGLDARGVLVLAGPLLDEPGAGMTILRLPAMWRHLDVRALATEEDRAVSSGYLTVTVRPWRVVMTGALA
jgi:uncharacterized protein YciI